jgi:hypothetical protein
VLAAPGVVSYQPQDFVEQTPRHRNLGHLERDVAPVAYDLRADLDELLSQCGRLPNNGIVMCQNVTAIA